MTELFAAKAARWYGVGVAVSYALMITLYPEDASASALGAIFVQALTSASWVVAGLTASSAARDLAARDLEDGIFGLAALRGYGPRRLEQARALAAARHIALWVGGPLLALVAVGFGKLAEPRLWAWALAWAAFVAAYAAALGASIGTLARFCAWLSPRYARGVLFVLVIGPELANRAGATAPSLPAWFAWALQRMHHLGGVLA